MHAPPEDQPVVVIVGKDGLSCMYHIIPGVSSEQVRTHYAETIESGNTKMVGVYADVRSALIALEALHPAGRTGCTRIHHHWQNTWRSGPCESYWYAIPSKWFDFVVPRMTDETVRRIIMDGGPVLFADERHASAFTKANKGFVIRGKREHNCCKVAFDAKLTARRDKRASAKERKRIADAEIFISELGWFISTIVGGYVRNLGDKRHQYNRRIEPSRAWNYITKELRNGPHVSIKEPYMRHYSCATDYPATEAQHRDTNNSRGDGIDEIVDCYQTMDWLVGHKKLRSIYTLLRASPEYRRVLRHFRKYIPGLLADGHSYADRKFGKFLIRELKSLRYVRVGKH